MDFSAPTHFETGSRCFNLMRTLGGSGAQVKRFYIVKFIPFFGLASSIFTLSEYCRYGTREGEAPTVGSTVPYGIGLVHVYRTVLVIDLIFTVFLLNFVFETLFRIIGSRSCPTDPDLYNFTAV